MSDQCFISLQLSVMYESTLLSLSFAGVFSSLKHYFHTEMPFGVTVTDTTSVAVFISFTDNIGLNNITTLENYFVWI